MQNKKIEIEFFEKYKKNGYEVFEHAAYKKFLSFFCDIVKPKEKEKVIEFGCGTGAFTKYLIECNLDITGIDISKGCVDRAKKNIKNANFIVGDIEKTEFNNQVFDIVVASGTLHHFPDFSKVITEASRILKPGGKFFAYEPNRQNPAMWLYRDKNSPLRSDEGVTAQERLLTKKEIENVFSRCGFQHIEVFATSGITYKYVEGKLASKLLKHYNLWERVFDKIWISKYLGSFLIVFAKK